MPNKSGEIEAHQHVPIAVVDDTEQNRYAISRYLHRAGFDVWEGSNGADALRLAGLQPGLLILDVKMPDMLGYDVCRRIKSQPETASVPVLMTSATFLETQNKVQGLEGGADAYLTAPIKPEELIATVKALLRTHEAEKKAATIASQWQTTFDAIGHGVCLANDNGNIERCNKAFAEMAGLSHSEIIGRIYAELPLVARGSAEYDKMRKAKHRQVVEFEAGNRSFRLAIDPVFDSHCELEGAVFVLADISEAKRTEKELREAQKQLEKHALDLEKRVAERTAKLQESNRALESFCYSIAHDLRAPARALQGLTGILVDDYGNKLDEAGHDYAHRIMVAAHRMNELIQDLLTYGRLSHMDLPMSWVGMPQLVKRVEDEFRDEIELRGAVIECQLEQPEVWANPTALEQAVANLVSNALKFSRPGVTPLIRIKTADRDSVVRIAVEDNGIGISPQYRERIFGVFERGEEIATYPGTGIGLALVKKAVERMSGRLGIDSERGKGSCFWIELPKSG